MGKLKLKNYLTVFYVIFILISTLTVDKLKALSSIVEKTSEMKKYEGFFPYYWDEKTGKIFLEVNKIDEEFIFLTGLQTGVGSNDVGLDRGRLGRTKIVKFTRTGPKIKLTQSNYTYVAKSNNPAEVKAVDEAFAKSVLWGFEIVGEENGHPLIDLTPYLLSDAYNINAAIKRRKEGNYKIDPSRSSIFLPNTKNFPENSEFESEITMVGEPGGKYIQDVVPAPNAITVRVHYSMVKLPDDNFEPREYDPRSSFNSVEYYDYATPISEPLIKRYAPRHRLKKKDPTKAKSEPVEPIIYYLDPGTPEPVRSALLEGASWWNQAFEEAGFINGFQVKMLPEDVDPLDVRYNVIQWVHRSTRGWSYGISITDPRTGEIIKGKVTLGSLRVRQDFLIAQSLLAPYEDGKPVPQDMLEMALARLRQLSAHEIGHTLGLAHNHLSHMNDRASVMDYPHPLATLNKEGKMDLSKAYATGIGAWDKVSITWGYSEFQNKSKEKEALNDIIQKSIEDGLLYLTTRDARPIGTAHPLAHQWINGKNPTKELYRLLEIRKTALANFSEKSIPVGRPMALLEEVLVPVYLSHRYQVHAVYKSLGGQSYTYALRGDGQTVTEMVSAEDQEEALEALIYTLQPEVLAVPEKIVKLIPPRPNGFDSHRELFPRKTGITFDPVTIAESTADLTLKGVFYPERVSRVVAHHAIDSGLPGFDKIVDKILESTWKAPRKSGNYEKEIQRVVENLVLTHLMSVEKNEDIASTGRAIAHAKIEELSNWISEIIQQEKDAIQKAHYTFALSEINEYKTNPDIKPMEIETAPPGAPIGMPGLDLVDIGCANE